MPPKSSNVAIAFWLVIAIFLWGGNNAGTRFIVRAWPPVWTGSTRFICAGLLLLAIIHWTSFLGRPLPLTPHMRRQLWIRGGLSLGLYIVCFNWALRYTSASHVALYLGASPVWALLWEGRPERSWKSLQRYAAAALALGGVGVLFWPALGKSSGNWTGELLGLASSVLWTHYGRQCRILGGSLPGSQVSAHTMWRAGLVLLPVALIEIAHGGLGVTGEILAVQSYCIIAGGVIAFAIWNNALRHWPASQVLLFNNLIPVSTMAWSHVWLDEAVTSTFWTAMILIVAGVLLGRLASRRTKP